MFKKFIFSIFFFLFYQNLFSKSITFDGLSKITIEDLQTLSQVDIYRDNLDLSDINKIIKDLVNSELIYEINYIQEEDYYLLQIEESKVIENIYINNNKWIKDDLIINNLFSKKNSFLLKENLDKDISIIKKVYNTKGFKNAFITSSIEKFSEDRVNLIFFISENNQEVIDKINFIGNNFVSNKYLNSLIKSESLSFYNIFKSGSNLDYAIFDFDKNQITSFYRNNGFEDVKVSYTINKSTFDSYILDFYIEEGIRQKINNINFLLDENLIQSLSSLISDFKNEINKNKNFYNDEIINEYLEKFNNKLINVNITNLTIHVDKISSSNSVDLNFIVKNINPKIINKIDVFGNSITKEKTIRSKISFEPGDYYSPYNIDRAINSLNNYPYIKSVDISENFYDDYVDLTIEIDEQIKTGNIMLAGTFNDDTGVGATFGIEDKNIFGSGNSINSNFSVNEEDLRFEIKYKQYPVLNQDLSNTYTVYNQENDYTKSYGYKATKQGLGYSINFNQSKSVSYGAGVSYENFEGHSPVNNNTVAINDNIGDFENFKLTFNINQNNTNDFFYPTNGYKNTLRFVLSPEEISDNPYYKLTLINKNYREFKRSNNYIFLNNSYGYAKSLNKKLNTINAFGLGGLNFKGFDYKGIGPYTGNIYLGGNEFFTSTLGYGSSFIFDDKDNINIKFFITAGSIWNSDYVTNSDIELRSSLGTSFDLLTAIGPISFSYAVPIDKNNSDRTRSFNFSIGTSF